MSSKQPPINDLQDLSFYVDSQIAALQVHISHCNDMTHARLTMLEEQVRDHETRIRSATEGVTQFKIFSGLASGGSSILAVIALIKALFF
jgi:hypothetical protein